MLANSGVPGEGPRRGPGSLHDCWTKAARNKKQVCLLSPERRRCPALARLIERRTEAIEFVANRIVLNDLGLQIISHGGWKRFKKSERHVCGKSRP